MALRIVGIGTASPEFSITQSDVAEVNQSFCHGDEKRRRAMMAKGRGKPAAMRWEYQRASPFPTAGDIGTDGDSGSFELLSLSGDESTHRADLLRIGHHR